MEKNKLMSKKVAEEILDINNIRNTFHFNKPRIDINVELEKVEKAFNLLYKIIQSTEKILNKK